MADLYNLLKQDHEQLRSQLHAMLQSSQLGRPLDKGALDVLKASLIAHTRAEEHLLYERFKGRTIAEPLAYDSYEEHDLAEHLLRELEDVSEPKVLTAKLRILEQLLTRHIEREETEGFDYISEVITADEMAQVTQSFSELRKQIQADLMGEPVRREPPEVAGIM